MLCSPDYRHCKVTQCQHSLHDTLVVWFELVFGRITEQMQSGSAYTMALFSCSAQVPLVQLLHHNSAPVHWCVSHDMIYISFQQLKLYFLERSHTSRYVCIRWETTGCALHSHMRGTKEQVDNNHAGVVTTLSLVGHIHYSGTTTTFPLPTCTYPTVAYLHMLRHRYGLRLKLLRHSSWSVTIRCELDAF